MALPTMALGKRWQARILYIDGSQSFRDFDEFPHLADIIEGGPDWRLIKQLVIRPLTRAPIGDHLRDRSHPIDRD